MGRPTSVAPIRKLVSQRAALVTLLGLEDGYRERIVRADRVVLQWLFGCSCEKPMVTLTCYFAYCKYQNRRLYGWEGRKESTAQVPLRLCNRGTSLDCGYASASDVVRDLIRSQQEAERQRLAQPRRS